MLILNVIILSLVVYCAVYHYAESCTVFLRITPEWRYAESFNAVIDLMNVVILKLVMYSIDLLSIVMLSLVKHIVALLGVIA